MVAKSNIELLNSYSNTNKAALVQKIESAAAAQGGYYTVFYGQDGNKNERENPGYTDILKEEIGSKFPQAKILATVAPDGRRAVVCYTQEPLAEIVSQYQQTSGESLKRDERVIPFHERYELTKWRGHLGNMGQFFILLSGLGMNKYVAQLFGEKVKGKDKFSSPEKVVSTIASVMGNGLNSWFGVQKKPDDLRLSIVKRKSTAYIHKYSAEPLDLPDNRDRLTPYTWREKPETTDEKTTVFFEQNAGIMSEVLKIVGKYSYFKGGQKKDNDGDRVHGAVSMAAKFVTVLGKDEDPYGLDNSSDWFSRLRQKSNLISGGMEWIANISQFAGAIMDKVPAALKPDAFFTKDKNGNTVKVLTADQELRFANTFGEQYSTIEDLTTGENPLLRLKKEKNLRTNTIEQVYVFAKNHLSKGGSTEQQGYAGDKVAGFSYLPGKEKDDAGNILQDKREMKLRGKPSSSWLMFDFNNSFLQNWKKWDWLQLIGATFFTLSLTTKMMAPFTEKKVNTDELFAHNAVGIAALPEYQRAEQLAGLTQHLIEMKAPSGIDMLPELTKKGFAETYAGIANTLYQRHQWDVAAEAIRQPTQPVPQPEVAQPEVNAEVTAPASKTEEKPQSVVAEVAETQAPTVTQTLAESAVENSEKSGGTILHDLRDRIAEARERGAGAFAEKYGATEGMALGAAAAT